MQNRRLLCQQIVRHEAYARDVGFRLVKTFHDTELDRIGADHEYDRRCGGYLTCCHHRCGSARSHNDRNAALDKFSDQGLQTVVTSLCPAGLNAYRLPLYESGSAKTSAKIGKQRRKGVRRTIVYESDHR